MNKRCFFCGRFFVIIKKNPRARFSENYITMELFPIDFVVVVHTSYRYIVCSFVSSPLNCCLFLIIVFRFYSGHRCDISIINIIIFIMWLSKIMWSMVFF